MVQGGDFLSDLYAQAVRRYEATVRPSDGIAATEAESTRAVKPEMVGLVSAVDFRLSREKRRYLSKLKRVFHLYHVPDESIVRAVELRAQASNVTRIMFKMEELSYRFRIVRALVEMLGLGAADFETASLAAAPVDVVLFLLPDYDVASREEESDAPDPEVSRKRRKGLEDPTEPIEEENEALKEYIRSQNITFTSSPFDTLSCSLNLTQEGCDENAMERATGVLVIVTDAPDYDHLWFEAAFEIGSPIAPILDSLPETSADKALIDALHIIVISYANSILESDTVSADDRAFLEKYFAQQRTILGHLPREQATHGAYLMEQGMTKSIVEGLHIRPSDVFAANQSLAHPVLRNVFEKYISAGVNRNARLHRLMCDTRVVDVACDDDSEATGTELFEKVMRFAEEKAVVNNQTSTLEEARKRSSREQAMRAIFEALGSSSNSSSSSDGDETAATFGGDVAQLELLQGQYDEGEVGRLVETIDRNRLRAVAEVAAELRLTPSEVGLGKNASHDGAVREVFAWYYTEMGRERRRVLLQVDKMFKQRESSGGQYGHILLPLLY